METKVNKNKKGVDEMLSLRDILDIFIFNWKWFILSIIICLVVARLYLSTRPNIYQRSAVMLVKDDGNTSGASRSAKGTDALMQLNGVMMGSSVKNEVYILQSHQLMKDVALQLHLDVRYIYKHHFKQTSLYDVKPFTAVFDSIETEVPYSFWVELTGRQAKVSDVVYNNEELEFEKSFELGECIEMPFGSLTLVPEENFLEEFDGKKIQIVRTTIDAAANAYGNSLKASELDKESTLVGITYSDNNIQRATDILNAVLDAYRRGIIDDKNRIAESTANFIDKRIEFISKELSAVEGELARFKRRNQLVNIEDNARQFLQESSQARQRSIQLESQIGVVRYLLSDLKNNSSNDLIPSLGGLTDGGIQSQIAQYNEKMLQLNRLTERASNDNPHIQQMQMNLKQMKKAIIASTEAHLSSLQVQLTRARQEEEKISGSITEVPEKEKEGLDIARQQTIKETLYTYLLNKREETALQLAITEANIRIVEQPFGSNIPISPRKKVIMLVALLLGIVLPFAFFHIRNLLNMSVRGRKDIETYTTIPVLGEIPHRKEGVSDAEILVGYQKTDSINESFRMLRFSLNFIQKDARVIMFTSTTPGEGKTFVSRNFAVTLGMTGKKVVLIDADIRKRTQSRLSGTTHREGLTSFLSGSTNDISNLIFTEYSDYNVDMMPAGITPPNPSELLMSDRLELLIEELKKKYDYIVIDNVPAQVVADAGIVNRVADVTLYVIREGKIDRRYLPELERLYKENKFNHLCIVINDSKMEEKRYGYGYGYGRHGYGYGNYGYGYGTSDNDKHRNKKKK